MPGKETLTSRVIALLEKEPDGMDVLAISLATGVNTVRVSRALTSLKRKGVVENSGEKSGNSLMVRMSTSLEEDEEQEDPVLGIDQFEAGDEVATVGKSYLVSLITGDSEEEVERIVNCWLSL